MSYGGGFNKFSAYLIGDLLSITPEDLMALAGIFLFVVVVWGIIFNHLLVLSINPSFARSRGIPALLIEGIFASVLAVVVAISIQWVGLLIINSMVRSAGVEPTPSAPEANVLSTGLRALFTSK